MQSILNITTWQVQYLISVYIRCVAWTILEKNKQGACEEFFLKKPLQFLG